jgi:hypothetical protein
MNTSTLPDMRARISGRGFPGAFTNVSDSPFQKRGPKTPQNRLQVAQKPARGSKSVSDTRFYPPR